MPIDEKELPPSPLESNWLVPDNGEVGRTHEWAFQQIHILLFGDQYLSQIAMDLNSVKKCPKYLTLPHLLDTHLISTFIFKKINTCSLSIVQWIVETFRQPLQTYCGHSQALSLSFSEMTNSLSKFVIWFTISLGREGI